MKQDLKKLINKIWMRDKQDQAIDLINSICGDKRQQILKNPKFKTLKEWVLEYFGEEAWLNDNEMSRLWDKYESAFEINKEMWPYIFNNNYYYNAEVVMLAFFKKYPKMRLEFLAKQNIVNLDN